MASSGTTRSVVRLSDPTGSSSSCLPMPWIPHGLRTSSCTPLGSLDSRIASFRCCISPATLTNYRGSCLQSKPSISQATSTLHATNCSEYGASTIPDWDSPVAPLPPARGGRVPRPVGPRRSACSAAAGPPRGLGKANRADLCRPVRTVLGDRRLPVAGPGGRSSARRADGASRRPVRRRSASMKSSMWRSCFRAYSRMTRALAARVLLGGRDAQIGDGLHGLSRKYGGGYRPPPQRPAAQPPRTVHALKQRRPRVLEAARGDVRLEVLDPAHRCPCPDRGRAHRLPHRSPRG